MAPKNTRNTPGHDDVSGLFARLGTQASQGYQDFAYPQLPPRKAGGLPAGAPVAGAAVPDATDAVAPPAPASPAVPVAGTPPAAPPSPVLQAAAAAEQTASLQRSDALAPLRKLRQVDEPGPRGLPSPSRPAQTPLEQLFQRLLQADARSNAHSPLKRLRSR
ncbi:hypothetical protein [Xanthomonas sp. NCPPB 1325]|uniref:hypothetical protein n=1 Tax=Xanthomonas sp. NCPPB 1325 TaxID=487529 RepID=UPI00355831CD